MSELVGGLANRGLYFGDGFLEHVVDHRKGLSQLVFDDGSDHFPHIDYDVGGLILLDLHLGHKVVHLVEQGNHQIAVNFGWSDGVIGSGRLRGLDFQITEHVFIIVIAIVAISYFIRFVVDGFGRGVIVSLFLFFLVVRKEVSGAIVIGVLVAFLLVLGMMGALFFTFDLGDIIAF